MNNPQVTINARKHDGTVHRSWQAKLLAQKGDLLIFLGVFDRKVIHPDLGIIEAGTLSYEYYWLNDWFNVFRFHESDGSFRNFYCNINKPPIFDGATLNYTDLDIDLLVRPDMSVELLDLEEFERNCVRYTYSAETVKTALRQVDVVKSMIFDRKFPFDKTEI